MGNSKLQSSLTKKFVMAFAGLFLITFLFVHMTINLLVLLPSTDWFNMAAHFMGTNILIKIFEFVLFGGFIVHIVYGIFIQIQNWIARPQRYKVEGWSHTSPFSKFMIHTAVLIFIFLVLHLSDFYIKAKFLHQVGEVAIDGKMYHDLGALVIEKFQIPLYVFGYIIMMVFLGFHLHHGFQSAFQSLGLNHSKYTPLLKWLSTIIAIILAAGYIIIPVSIYFGNY
ncbi:MAG: succinate dehydrogenase cytochrome b subunit [Bacteroidales bacterium]|nr:succinate dehydrogenase cytochrome b subunit [Bacteroidales bacterium]MCF8405005.1 succinate dehydrogenase cytochrome b subunit [Bacteroidales bacterium]